MSKNVAIVFPGQGSQFLGMLNTLIQRNSIKVLQLLDEASEAVSYDVAKLISDGPIERLNQTEFTQVAMLAADVAYYHALLDAGYSTPSLMAGHSLGEYAALVCAQSLSFTDAVKLVSFRGKTMQQTIPQGVGAMAAIIGMDTEALEEICAKASNESEQVVLANFNAKGQTVVAGHVNAVNKAVVWASDSGAVLAKIIPVSVPCHCSLLRPASEIFASALAKVSFEPPAVPVLSNIDANAYLDAEDIKQRLASQLYEPVQWVNTIKAFSSRGIDEIIECGPGRTLLGLIKRTDKSFTLSSASDKIEAQCS